MKISTIIKELDTAQSKYNGAIGRAEKLIQPHINFEATILHQESDGFVVSDSNMGNAPLDDCLSHIKKYGFLEHSDYLTLCI